MIQLNIGVGHNKELMEKCPLLAQYSQYVGRVKQYSAVMPLKDAVERAVNECIQEGILADFLRKHRAEAIEVSIFEYDEEKELELFRAAEREVAHEEGLEAGRKEGQIEKLVDLVWRKLRKGKSAETIADELEEDLENVTLICEAAAQYAPAYDSHLVYEDLKIR